MLSKSRNNFIPCPYNCDGLECGDDGCGRSCGSCDVGESCNNNVCVESEKIVFVTEGVYEGDLGGLAGADAICQSDAEDAGLTVTFRAWLSDSASSPATDPSWYKSPVPYLLTDGRIIAENWQDLTDGVLLNAIDRTAGGNVVGQPEWVWTNTRIDGSAYHLSSLQTCDEFTTKYTGTSAIGRLRPSSPADWTEYLEYFNCGIAAHLYCIQNHRSHFKTLNLKFRV